MIRRTLIIATCVALAATMPARAADCPEQVGHWPYGSTTAIAHTGSHIVYSAGTVLKVADVSTPSAPTVAGELRLGAIVWDLDASGAVAVVASLDRGLLVVDLSDPSHPSLAASLDEVGKARAVALDGQTAWLAADHSLVAVDVRDPSHPEVISSSDLGIGNFTGITVSGDLAMVLDFGKHTIYTVDISDPSSPQLLGSTGVDYPVGAAIADGYAYVADRSTGVQVIDISDPSNPTIVTTVEEGGDYYVDVEVAGTLLLVSHRNYGLVTLDITAPSAPTVLGRLNTPGEAESAAFHNGAVFIADGYRGVTIASLSDPSQPQPLAALPGSGPIAKVAAAGDLAAAVDVGDLDLFDLSNPSTPTLLATYDPDGFIKDVELSGSHAYVVLSNKALEAVDVTDPAHPEKEGSLHIEKGELLALDGDRAVIAGDGLLTVADISDPAHPAELGRLDLDYSRAPSDVFLAGTAAYLSEYWVGLHVIDLTDPAHPTDAGLIPMEGASHAGAVQGNLLFIGDSRGGGVRIFDISDPLHPHDLSTATTAHYFSGLDVSGNLLAVATIWEGIFIVDVSDPVNPVVVGTAPMVAKSEADAALAGGLFVVAELDAGLEVFDLSECAVEPPKASFAWTPAIPEAGQTVQFTDTSSGTIESWEWSFSDGRVLSEQNPSRAFGHLGSFAVTLTVTGPMGSDSVTRVVTVSGGSSIAPPIGDSSVWSAVIPASAHTGGLHHTTWVSDVVLHNPGTVKTTAYLYFLEKDRDNSGATGWAINVDPGSSVALDDIVLALFGKSATSGAILVKAGRELVVTSRTYNDATSGTFGQFIPGLPVPDATSNARLIQLTRGSSFRTNIGLANPTGQPLTAKIRLRDAGGTQVGNEVSVSLHPYGFHQVTGIFPTDVPDGAAEIWTDTAGGAFFAYASVVDNVTGDPVFVLEAPAADDLWIPAAAHVNGYQGTQWRTDLELANGSTSAGAAFTIELLKSGQDNSAPKSITHEVGAGATNRLGDFLDQSFHFTGSAALHVMADLPDSSISSRTYNQTAHGTYGQYIPGLTGEAAVTPSHPARLVQLHQSTSNTTGFRTNIGVLNTTASSVDVSIALHAWDGALLGTVPVTLKPYELKQVDKIFRSVTSSPVTNGYAVLTTEASGGRVLAYASVIDNASGDPVCVLPQ